jgi:predicted CXXCH cytochrome family protein
MKGLGMAYRGIRHSVVLLSLVALMTGVGISTAGVDHTKYDEVSECTRCHPRIKPTHWKQMPVDMQSLLPLDERGNMTCTTCHICTRKTCDLRETKEDLCRTCHDCTQGMACLLGTAHLGDSKDLKRASIGLCLQCHNSEGTPETCAVGNRTIHTSILKTTAKGNERRTVSFVDGEITCLSCHNPYNTQEFAKLVRSGRDMGLCTKCHGKLQKFDHAGFKETEQCITCHPRVTPTHTQQKPYFMKTSLPLDEEGRMLCTTCHTCTSEACDIRGDNKAELCQVCHDCTGGMSCMIGTPHLGSELDRKRAQIDACRDCHDGITAPAECTGLRGREIRERMERTGETCVSCHDPYDSHKTSKEKLQSTKEHSIQKLRDAATFCPRLYVEIMDDRDCQRCHHH